MWDIKTHKPRWPALVATAILALFLVGLYPVLAAPPGNDDIATATIISGLPYSVYNFDTTEATAAGDDPLPSCNYYGVQGATVWYEFTPDATMLVLVSTSGSTYTPTMGVYIEDQGTLSEIHCATHNYPGTFQVAAGQTYYIMIGAVDAGAYPYPPSGYGGALNFSIEAAPPPVAGFSYSPDYPSTLDVLQFYNWSYDPVCYGCPEYLLASWDFGDGITSQEYNSSHQYAADGDYTVSLTVTTQDGRTATTTQNLQVRTNDVAITKFTVPNAAKVGQTRSVAVEVKNTQHPVRVQVTLYRSNVSGWEWVGTLVQEVPVTNNRTTKFAYSYTFTSQDGALGSVNFRAEAVIQDGRDALPVNNEAMSLPTKVNP